MVMLVLVETTAIVALPYRSLLYLRGLLLLVAILLFCLSDLSL